jgi:hypothetical protein
MNTLTVVVLLPLTIGIIGSVIGNVLTPVLQKWYASISITAANQRIAAIKVQIDEVETYKNSAEKLYRVALREILRAMWYVFTVGLALTVVLAATFLSFSTQVAMIVQGLALGFVWGQLSRALSMCTWVYRLARDTIEFEDFRVRQEGEIKFLEAAIAKNSSVKS